jgi:hypothetical protein
MIATAMQRILKAGKVLIALGVAFVALGLLCVFLEAAGMGESLIPIWSILSAAGAFCAILGAISFCANAPPKEVVTSAGWALGVLALLFVTLAIFTPNANVHGPIMPVILALVGFGTLALVGLLAGLIRLASKRDEELQ